MNSLAAVLARSDVWRGDRCANAPLPSVSTGFPALDAALPGAGWPCGALTELLVDEGAGRGELGLLMPALRAVGASVLVAAPHRLHAPAWRAAGVDLSNLLVIEAPSARDALWATEQALASGAPGVVVCWEKRADARAIRRLQVAATTGRAVAFLFRPSKAAREASAAPLRLRLSAAPMGRLAVAIFKRRGPPLDTPLELDLPRPAAWRHDHESPLAGPVPAPAAARRLRGPAWA